MSLFGRGNSSSKNVIVSSRNRVLSHENAPLVPPASFSSPNISNTPPASTRRIHSHPNTGDSHYDQSLYLNSSYQTSSYHDSTSHPVPFPSFSHDNSEYDDDNYTIDIHNHDELEQLIATERSLVTENKKNMSFGVFISVNIVFLLVVSALIYVIHNSDNTTTDSLGRRFTHRADFEFTVQVDPLSSRFYVIDNNPIPNFPYLPNNNLDNPSSQDPHFPPSSIITDHKPGKHGETIVANQNNKVILADGVYTKNLNNNGWNYLSIETMDLKSFANRLNQTKGNSLNDAEQLATIRQQYIRNMKALGYLEGYVTCNEVKQYYENFFAGQFSHSMNLTQEAVDFLLSNYEWMSIQSDLYYEVSNYWLVVRGLIAQINGLVLGTRDGCTYLAAEPPSQAKSSFSSASSSYGSGSPDDPSSFHFSSSFQTMLTEKDFNERSNTYNNVFLPSMHRRPELIHFLLVNANGDLFQIKQKYDVIEKMPESVNNDDIDRQDDDDGVKTIVIPGVPSMNSSSSTDAASGPDPSINIVTPANPPPPPAPSPPDNPTAPSQTTYGGYETPSATSNNNAGDGTSLPTVTPATQSTDNGMTTGIADTATIRRRMEEMSRIFPVTKNHHSHSGHHLRSTFSKEELSNKRRQLAEKMGRVLLSGKQKERNLERKRGKRHDHCSALIKLLDNNTDVVFGHNTWDDFSNAAPRIFKHYSYTLLQESKPAKKFDVYFSSSPGLLGSVDDFYVVHGYGHMTVLETS
jgi:hypothetical protein